MTVSAPDSLDEVRAFLRAAGLPDGDLGSVPTEARVVQHGGAILGTIAVERYGTTGLLRSLAVAEPARGAGLGAQLVTEAERVARGLGLDTLVLLTATAEGFFRTQGYTRIDRGVVPDDVRTSTQFRGACCASAVCLAKRL